MMLNSFKNKFSRHSNDNLNQEFQTVEIKSKNDIFKDMKASPVDTIRLIGIVAVWFFGFETFFANITAGIMKFSANALGIVLSEVNKGIVNQVYNVIYFALAVILTTAVMIGHRSIKHINFKVNKKEIKFILTIFIMMYLWNVASSMFINAVIQKESANQGAIEAMSSNLFLTFLMTVVLAPFAEEMMYRVGLSGILSKRSIWFAILFSGFLFGFAHIQGYVVDPTSSRYDPQQWWWLLNYGGMGIIFSYAYHRSGKFAVPYYLHMGNNLIAFLGMLILNLLK